MRNMFCSSSINLIVRNRTRGYHVSSPKTGLHLQKMTLLFRYIWFVLNHNKFHHFFPIIFHIFWKKKNFIEGDSGCSQHFAAWFTDTFKSSQTTKIRLCLLSVDCPLIFHISIYICDWLFRSRNQNTLNYYSCGKITYTIVISTRARTITKLSQSWSVSINLLQFRFDLITLLIFPIGAQFQSLSHPPFRNACKTFWAEFRPQIEFEKHTVFKYFALVSIW